MQQSAHDAGRLPGRSIEFMALIGERPNDLLGYAVISDTAFSTVHLR